MIPKEIKYNLLKWDSFDLDIVKFWMALSLVLLPMVYIFISLFILLVHLLKAVTLIVEIKTLTAKLLTQG